MGIVLKGFDPLLRRTVAIKVLAPQLVASSTGQQRFLREAQAAAAVTHEHVVAIHRVCPGPPPYLVLQFIDGVNLEEHQEPGTPLAVEVIQQIGMQLAAGLAAAHARGLVHRDIKPANILLEAGAALKVKVTDFGLARAVDDASLSQLGLLAGTPLYMSPEQARGEMVDARADLFSLGSVLYLLCTGQPAFRGPNTMAVLRRVCEETPTPIRQVNPQVPAWLDAIVMKLLAKEPARHFQSAAALAEALALKKAPSEQPVHAPRRRGWRAVGVGLLLLAVGVGPAWLALQPGGDEGPLPPRFTNSVGMEFVRVPAGKFWMGGTAGKPGPKEVTIVRDFYLGVYEVTQQEWVALMKENPSGFSRTGDKREAVKDIPDEELQRFPVEMVTWLQAKEFLQELNQRDHKPGWVYRLPEEAEWEYACRGGPETDPAESAFDFYFTEPTNELLPTLANYKFTGCLQRTSKVGSYPPNRLGLYDMHGNVNEWCQGSGEDGHHRPHCGGCWEFSPRYCRAGVHDSLPDKLAHDSLGLRVAYVRESP